MSNKAGFGHTNTTSIAIGFLVEARHDRAIVLGTGGRSTEPGEIQFAVDGKSVLQLFEDGRVLVNGELVDNDPRVADAFRDWLDGVLFAKPWVLFAKPNWAALGALVERLRQQVRAAPVSAWERLFTEAADTIESLSFRVQPVPTVPMQTLRLTMGALVERLRQQAGPDPYPNSYGGLFKEAADAIEALAAAAEKGEQA